VKIQSTSEYEQISLEDTFSLLQTSANGLSEAEAEDRVKRFGENKIEEEKRSPFSEFFSRYWGPMPWLLELAMALSFVLQHYLEVVIIFVLLTINVIIGFLHSRSSQRALEFLKKSLAIKARVMRDGKWVEKDAREIVPGDVFVAGLGDLVPADAKLLSGELTVDQSALTGESLPVNVQREGIVFSSSVVVRGEAKCVAVNTGAATYFGKTAELVKVAKPKSHQQEIMFAIIKYMMYVGIAALAIVSVDAAVSNISFLLILTFAAIFLIGAVPVALPAVLTIVQAVGAIELSKKQVLVTRLDSIEDAASMDVLCLDKTGTITQNKLSIVDSIPFFGYKREDVIIFAGLASKEESKDVIDLAIIEDAKTWSDYFKLYKQVSFTPFEPSTKRAEAIVEYTGQQFKVVKGAPQVVISLCEKLSEESRQKISKTVEELSQKGYRTLAVAKSQSGDTENLEFVGLFSLADPIRHDSKDMIEEAKELGVKAKMLTGDNIHIAKEIARQASIGAQIIRMTDLKNLSEAEQARKIEESDGFAEIYPEDKYKIVKLLQSRGHMVGMTGDGVNDAPALKQAEMGVAVSNSADVAKASASIVLTEQGIGVIIDAIKTSRKIYQRMLSWVINKVSKVIQFIGLLTIGFFWLHDIVISLLGMVLLVFANDFVTMSLATDNVKHTSNPNKWNVKNITLSSLLIGTMLVVEGAITVYIGVNYFDLTLEKLRTFVLLTLIFTSQFRVYIVRERNHFWSSRPGKELLTSTVATILFFAFLGVYGTIISPLAWYEVLFSLGFSALFTFSLDPLKYYVFRSFGL
jgi:H+-transporting ATPase